MQNFGNTFQITNLGDVSHYLRIEIDINLDKKTITFWQSIYLKKILGRYGMSKYKPAKILISPGVINSLTTYEDQAKKSTVALYQSAVKAFMWLAMYFRPDMAYSVGVFSYFCSNSKLVYIELIKYVLRYVCGILELGLIFNG